MTEKKPPPDWERVERDYRAGVKSLRQIAEEHGITHGAVNKRAKRDGWPRDLSAKITARAEQLVSSEAVSKQVSAETRATEREIIETNAQAIVQVRLAHRQDIHRSRTIVASMFAELEQQCGPESAALLEQLGDVLSKSDAEGSLDKMTEMYQKIVSLPTRAKTMKDLAESLGKVVAMERQAFNMDKDAGDKPTTSFSINF